MILLQPIDLIFLLCIYSENKDLVEKFFKVKYLKITYFNQDLITEFLGIYDFLHFKFLSILCKNFC